MRHFFLICLFASCLHTAAQNHLYKADSSVIGEVNLPPTLPEQQQGAHSSGGYTYLLSDHDIYHLFGYDSMKQFRDFDFANYHILGIQKCRQCTRVCHHDEGQTSCHRNRCNKGWVWFKRRNQTAFSPIPIINPGPARIGEADQHPYHISDTLIHPSPAADNGTVQWLTHSMGDCHGWFTYELLKDNFHPVVVLKESSHYGGCRAAGAVNVVVSFKPVEGDLYYLKNTVLVDRE